MDFFQDDALKQNVIGKSEERLSLLVGVYGILPKKN